MTDEILYLDRRLPGYAITLSAAAIIAGLVMSSGSDDEVGPAIALTGAVFALVFVPFFWIKVAVLRSDHVQIGTRRFAYAQITRIDHGSEIVSDLAARVGGRNSRQQDRLTLYLEGQDKPVIVPVSLYRDGPAGVAAKIRARIDAAARD